MPARLPNPGSDDNTWGDILNGFLCTSHNTDGTLRTSSLQDAGAVFSVNGRQPDATAMVTITADDIGLENVNNTADIDKPVSTAQASLIATKAVDASVVHLAGNETITGSKTFSSPINTTGQNLLLTTASGQSIQARKNSVTAGDEANFGLRVSTAASSVDSAQLAFVRTNTPNSGDGDMVLRINIAGTLTEVFRISSTQNITSIANFNKRVMTVAYSSTITPNITTTDMVIVTLAGSVIVAAPFGNPVAGQVLMIRLKQDSVGSHTATWNAVYRFPGGAIPTLSTTAAKTDYIEFQYNSVDSTWDNIRFVGGF